MDIVEYSYKSNRSQMPYKPNTLRLLVTIYIMIAVLAGITVSSMNIPPTVNLDSKYLPSIVVDGQNMYVAWINSTLDHYQLHFKKSSDGGRTFEKVTTLAKDVVGQPSNPKININQKNLDVVWHINKTDAFTSLIATSKNKGNSFEEMTNITQLILRKQKGQE